MREVVIMISKHQPSMFKSPRRLIVAACAAAVGAGFQSIPTLAQSDLALEEVIVTATRRDESLQDVAVSVSAIDAELDQATVRRPVSYTHLRAHETLR